ncbi:MAG: histone deacetylase [Verrucomicrobiota bacterium]
MKPLGLVYDPVFKEHDTGPGHPERPERIEAVNEALAEIAAADSTHTIKAREATNEELARCHDERYIELVTRECAAAEFPVDISTGDAVISRESERVARLAAGATIEAVDAVFEKKCRHAFCATRPPGHHATASRGMGFCLFNNAAVAARHAQDKHGIERVVIIDWDVHHGNGTQDIFYEDGSVFYFSTHQYPFYPGTGAKGETGSGKGEGTTLNAPLPAGTGMKDVGAAFRDAFLKKMKEFKPGLVIISAGFDSRLGDLLGDFRLTDEDFAELTKLLTGLGEESADGRVVSMLEGGYALDGLASATKSHVETLVG